MTRTYTYFKRKKFSRDVLIYEGELGSMPSTAEADSLAYSIDLTHRRFELWQNTPHGSHSLLSGSFTGVFGYSASVSGDSLISSAKRNGIFSSGWTFVFMARKYRWRVTPFSSRWELRDGDRVLAEFERSRLRIDKIGVLRMLDESEGEMFRAMVLLTCEMVHRTVKSTERHAGGGG